MSKGPGSESSRLSGFFRSLKKLVGGRQGRVPLVLQMTPVECGAACLAMVLGYHGRQVQRSNLREALGSSRDGVKASSLARVARAQGLLVKSYSVDPQDLKYIPLPSIIHWKFNHFLVLEKWTSDQVHVVDPATGRLRIPMNEFSAGFTGVVMTFEKGARFAPQRKGGSSGWISYLRSIFEGADSRKILAQVLGASLLMQFCGLALPLFTKILVDEVIPGEIRSVLAMLALGLLVLVAAQVVTMYLRATLLIYLRGRLDSKMMSFFFEHMLSLPYSFYQQRTSGDLLMRLGSNSLIRETLTNQTLSMFLDVPFLLIYLLIIFSQSSLFGLVVLLLGVVQVVVILTTSPKVHRLAELGLAAQAEEQGFLVEALKGIASLKASGSEHRTLDHWANLFHNQLNLSLRASHFSALIDSALFALRVLSPLGLLWFGAWLVLDGQLSLGTMLALNAMSIAFLEPLRSLTTNARQLQLVGAYINRIADVLEAEPEISPDTTGKQKRITGGIEVRNLSFRYAADSPQVLQDVSFTVAAGSKVAVVGQTGSGKSTLALLLLGLHKVEVGDVQYDGISLKEFDPQYLRSQFGVVLQEPFVFSGTIRQNIIHNNPDMTLDEVIEAARTACIHEEIEQMPMGYDTFVAEGGTAISGGQRQRLAIARALAHRPKILILDEATSHLDAETEAQVERRLNRLRCTRIVIAHRLSTVKSADTILVLDRGRIVERGTHEELLCNRSVYAHLVAAQGVGRTPMADEPDSTASPRLAVNRDRFRQGE